MKYVRNPHKAQQMLALCHEGNYIFDVTVRYKDNSVAWFLSQAKSEKAAEKRYRKDKTVAAVVARRIIDVD